MISNPMAIHQFPGVLLGLTNTGAAIASLIGTFVTGHTLARTFLLTRRCIESIRVS